MSQDRSWDPETVFEVLGSSLARRLLALAEIRPCSAEELAAHSEASKPTVYRRLNVLEEYDLVTERRAIDDEGNHYKTYETNLESVHFEVTDGGFEVDIQLHREVIDGETDIDPDDDHLGVADDAASEGESATTDGTTTDSATTDGTTTDGATADGTTAADTAADGATVDETATDDTPSDGTAESTRRNAEE